MPRLAARAGDRLDEPTALGPVERLPQPAQAALVAQAPQGGPVAVQGVHDRVLAPRPARPPRWPAGWWRGTRGTGRRRAGARRGWTAPGRARGSHRGARRAPRPVRPLATRRRPGPRRGRRGRATTPTRSVRPTSTPASSTREQALARRRGLVRPAPREGRWWRRPRAGAGGRDRGGRSACASASPYRSAAWRWAPSATHRSPARQARSTVAPPSPAPMA